jgi:hypothetical protein
LFLDAYNPVPFVPRQPCVLGSHIRTTVHDDAFGTIVNVVYGSSGFLKNCLEEPANSTATAREILLVAGDIRWSTAL